MLTFQIYTLISYSRNNIIGEMSVIGNLSFPRRYADMSFVNSQSSRSINFIIFIFVRVFRVIKSVMVNFISSAVHVSSPRRQFIKRFVAFSDVDLEKTELIFKRNNELNLKMFIGNVFLVISL